MATDYKKRRTFTNNKKADWTQFIEDTESAFVQTTIPTNIHTANIFLTNIILMADSHNIPKRKMHSNCRFLADHTVCTMAPPALTITVALDMIKAFVTINIHTLIRKLLQTKIPGTIIKSIANYIKVHKANTTYRNRTSSQRQFKTGVLQSDVRSPTLFNIYTADITPPRVPVQVMAYADDTPITSTHTSTSAAKIYTQPYLHKVFA